MKEIFQYWGEYIVGIPAILFAYWFFKIQTKNKQLKYELVEQVKLIHTDSKLPNELKLFYGDKPVKNLSLLLLRLNNTGNQPILETDFIENIRISIHKEAQIMNAEIISSKPKRLNIEIY